MDMHQQSGEPIVVENQSDIELNKPSKSRFLFLLFFFGFFIFCWAGCYKLHQFGYKSSEDVKVPENTKYDPVYK